MKWEFEKKPGFDPLTVFLQRIKEHPDFPQLSGQIALERIMVDPVNLETRFLSAWDTIAKYPRTLNHQNKKLARNTRALARMSAQAEWLFEHYEQNGLWVVYGSTVFGSPKKADLDVTLIVCETPEVDEDIILIDFANEADKISRQHKVTLDYAPVSLFQMKERLASPEIWVNPALAFDVYLDSRYFAAGLYGQVLGDHWGTGSYQDDVLGLVADNPVMQALMTYRLEQVVDRYGKPAG